MLSIQLVAVDTYWRYRYNCRCICDTDTSRDIATADTDTVRTAIAADTATPTDTDIDTFPPSTTAPVRLSACLPVCPFLLFVVYFYKLCAHLYYFDYFCRLSVHSSVRPSVRPSISPSGSRSTFVACALRANKSLRLRFVLCVLEIMCPHVADKYLCKVAPVLGVCVVSGVNSLLNAFSSSYAKFHNSSCYNCRVAMGKFYYVLRIRSVTSMQRKFRNSNTCWLWEVHWIL